MRQAKKIYRWKTFIVSVVQLETGKEKQDKITGTIWAALLFFCCCVNWGSNLRLFVTSHMKTKAATGIHTKYIKQKHNRAENVEVHCQLIKCKLH